MTLLRSDELEYQRPSEEDYLGVYNELLASIVVTHPHSLKYIASITLNRVEGQTHFFEKVQKYIQIREQLTRNPSLSVVLIDDDRWLYSFLEKKFGHRVTTEKLRPSSIREYLKQTRILKFCIVFPKRFIETLFITVYAHIFARKRNERYESVIRTWFDFRCTDEQRNLREEYFGPFATDLAHHSKTLVVFGLIHLKDIVLYHTLRNHAPFDSCLVESCISPLTVCKVYCAYLVTTLFRKIRIGKAYYYHGINTTPLIQRSVDDDFWGFRNLVAFLEYEVAKNLLHDNPQRLYFPYENQTWEKTYPFVKKHSSSVATKIIGFQHTGLSYKILNYFPTKHEHVMSCFPDTIITVGSIYKRLLEEKAQYPCPIIAGAALRHMKHVMNAAFNIRTPDARLYKKIVYAFSYDVSKYKKIVGTLLRVFGDSSVTVYLKIHPLYDEQKIIRDINLKLPTHFIAAQTIRWEQLYREVDCVLYDDNSVGIEGLINGMKTFMLDVGEPIYDCNRMYYFDAQWKPTINEQELVTLKTDIENNTFDKTYDSEKITQYIYAYYTIYSQAYFQKYLEA